MEQHNSACFYTRRTWLWVTVVYLRHAELKYGHSLELGTQSTPHLPRTTDSRDLNSNEMNRNEGQFMDQRKRSRCALLIPRFRNVYCLGLCKTTGKEYIFSSEFAKHRKLTSAGNYSLHKHIHYNETTPGSRVLIETPIATQPVKKFTAIFPCTRMFIRIFQWSIF